MLLKQQNKKRLMMARQGQENQVLGGSESPPPTTPFSEAYAAVLRSRGSPNSGMNFNLPGGSIGASMNPQYLTRWTE
jgi:hypothetical protein